MFKPMCEGCGAELDLKAGLKKKCLDCNFPLSKKNLEAILSKEGLAGQNKPKATSPPPPPSTPTPKTEKCKSCGVEFYGEQLKDYRSGKNCYICGSNPKLEATPTGPSYQNTSKTPPLPRLQHREPSPGNLSVRTPGYNSLLDGLLLETQLFRLTLTRPMGEKNYAPYSGQLSKESIGCQGPILRCIMRRGNTS